MPRLEEIDDADDIDNLEMELAELDPSLKTPVAPRIVPEITRSQDLETSLFPNMPQFDLQNQPTTTNQPAVAKFTKEELEELKGFQLLYPCYFDKNRSQGQGRRVPIDCAVENPLAKTIADAIHSMGLLCVFEGEKCHPQDFGNPGRVRVLLKDEGKPTKPSTFPTKRALMKKVSEYLQAHPTTLKSLNEVPYGPDFEGFVPRVIPKVKGFVMNDIVPLHSAYSMGHPMSKSVYDEPQEIIPEKQVKMPKNKYKVVRR